MPATYHREIPGYGGGYGGASYSTVGGGGGYSGSGVYLTQSEWAIYNSSANTTSAGYYINNPSPEPARPYTSLDWLKDEVERVCAEARKVRFS